MSIRVQHCKKAMEFFVNLNNSKAVLQYSLLRDGKLMDMHHTGVPKEQQGKEVAKLLVLEAFKYAGENHLKVLPSCSYVEKFVKEQATAEQKALAVDWEEGSKL